jgi:hypothetical protein
MKKLLLVVSIVVIGLSLLADTALADRVLPSMFDVAGMKLYVPGQTSRVVVDVSNLIKFELTNVPPDKDFVKGKIFQFLLRDRYGYWQGLRYAIFTKWLPEKIEVFYFSSFVVKQEQPFLDCTLGSGGNDKYACIPREKNNRCTAYEMLFRDQKITIKASGCAPTTGGTTDSSAEGEVSGTFTLPATQDMQK